MRISDWSSDVCSSDLGRRDRAGTAAPELPARLVLRRQFHRARRGLPPLLGRIIGVGPAMALDQIPFAPVPGERLDTGFRARTAAGGSVDGYFQPLAPAPEVDRAPPAHLISEDCAQAPGTRHEDRNHEARGAAPPRLDDTGHEPRREKAGSTHVC